MAKAHRLARISDTLARLAGYAGCVAAALAYAPAAMAGCTVDNATITQCDSTGIMVAPNTGTSTLTVDGVTSKGIYYTPGDSATGTYVQNLIITGATTLNNPSGSSGFSGGNTVTLATVLAHQDVNISVGSGVSITAVAGYGGGIWARSETSGNIVIDSSATVHVTGVDGSDNPSVGAADGVTGSTNLGSVSVTNRGNVTSNGRGLYADGNSSSTVMDADLNVLSVIGPAKTVSINNTGTVNATQAGARSIDYNGLSIITNSGTVYSATRQALIAWSNYGDATIINSGTATSDDRNAIVVQSSTNGNATITNSGTVSASKAVSTGSAGIGYSGLRAMASTAGDVTVTNTATGVITSAYDAAIVGHTPNGTISITNNGSLTGLSGIFADSGSGTGSIDTITDTNASGATTTGRITVNNTGTVTTTSHGVYLDGTTNTFTNSGTVKSTGGIALLTGPGTSQITNSGTVQGQSGAISGTVTNLANSGLIAGSITNTGTSAMTLSGGNADYAVLTGYNGGSASLTAPGSMGTLSSTSDIAFNSGKLWLNDTVSMAGHTLSVGGGADLKISGNLQLNGAYVQTGGSVLFSNGGVLTLTGSNTASISNTAITLSGSNLTVGSSYTLVDTNVAGAYANNTIRVTGTRGLSGTLSTADNGHDLIATLSQTNYTGKGIVAGGAATPLGAALDLIDLSSSTNPVTTNFQTKVIDTLAQLPVQQQQQAIKQLAPIQTTPAAQTAQAAAPTTSVIEQHELALLGNGSSGETGMAAGSAPLGYGLWGQVIGGGALRNTANQVDGYRSRSFGLVAGVDHLLDDGGVIGLATSWTKGWNWGSDGASGTFATMNSYQLTGYGLHRFGMAFLDWQLGVGYNQFSQTRAISFLNQQAKADFDGQQYLVKVGGGHDFAIGGQTTLTPLASLRFLRAVSDGYSESGSDANLTIERRGVQSLTHDLGGKVSWKFSSDIGQITPEVRLAWEHDYTQGPIASSGLIGGQSFTSTTARPSPDGAKLNLAVTLDTTDTMSLRAEYEGDMRADYQSHTGLVKATWEF